MGFERLESGQIVGINVGRTDIENYDGPLTDAVNGFVEQDQAAWVKGHLGTKEDSERLQKAAKVQRARLECLDGPELGLASQVGKRQKALKEYLEYALGPCEDGERLSALWQRIKDADRDVTISADQPGIFLPPGVFGFPALTPKPTMAETMQDIVHELNIKALSEAGLNSHFSDGRIPSPDALAQLAPDVKLALENSRKEKNEETEVEEVLVYESALELLRALRGHEENEDLMRSMREKNPELWEKIPPFTGSYEVQVYLRAHIGDTDFDEKLRRVKKEYKELWDDVEPTPIVFEAKLKERRSRHDHTKTVQDLAAQVQELRDGGFMSKVRRLFQ